MTPSGTTGQHRTVQSGCRGAVLFQVHLGYNSRHFQVQLMSLFGHAYWHLQEQAAADSSGRVAGGVAAGVGQFRVGLGLFVVPAPPSPDHDANSHKAFLFTSEAFCFCRVRLYVFAHTSCMPAGTRSAPPPLDCALPSRSNY